MTTFERRINNEARAQGHTLTRGELYEVAKNVYNEYGVTAKSIEISLSISDYFGD